MVNSVLLFATQALHAAGTGAAQSRENVSAIWTTIPIQTSQTSVTLNAMTKDATAAFAYEVRASARMNITVCRVKRSAVV